MLIDIRSKTPRTNGTRRLSQIKYIARHHSATETGSWETFWPYWRDTNKWGTGGYHEIILRNGDVQLCYDPEEITNGVKNHNHHAYHICVVGNGSFTEAQEKAFDERCKLAMKKLNIPVSNVLGHKEFKGASTSCPGINMDVVRARLKEEYKVAETNEPADWAKVSWEKACKPHPKTGIPTFDGTNPQRVITGEMLAVILDRHGLLD